MPRVPTYDRPKVQPQATPNVPQQVRSSPADFGAGIGRSLQGVGAEIGEVAKEIQKADKRIDERQWAVGRARALGDFNERAFQELTRAQTEGDLSRPESVGAFGRQLDNLYRETLGGHAGSPESAARLAERLEGVRSSYMSQATAASVKAQRALVQRTAGDALDRIAVAATEKPGSIPELWAAWDAEVDNLASALTPDEEATFRKEGRQMIAARSLKTLADRGEFSEAVASRSAAASLAPEIRGAIAAAAEKHGENASTLARIAMIESGGNAAARNPGSSAKGLFQFTDATASQYDLANPLDPAQSADAAARLLRDNRAALRKFLGREPSEAEAYLAHQQGGQGAADLLNNPDRPAIEVLTDVYGSRDQARMALGLNGGRDGMTARQFAGKWIAKFEADAEQAPTVQSILALPGMKDILGAETLGKVNAQMIAHERGQEKAQQEFRQKIDVAKSALGLGPNDEVPLDIRLKLAGIEPKQPPEALRTISGKIQMLEAAGIELTPERLEKLIGTDGDGGGAFGNGLTGRALEIMTDQAPSFAAGLTSEEDDRRFISAVTQFTQPVQYQNPDTGLLETRRAELPPFVAEAMERRGMAVPNAGTQNGQPRALGAGAPTAQPGTAPAPATATGGAPDAAAQQPEAAIAPDKTIWGLVDAAQGPVPAVADWLSNTPIVGDFIRAPEMTGARTFIPLLQRDLVRVLQNNPRYAEGERQAIEEEISIKPEFWGNPNNLRDRLVSIDGALEVRLQNARKTADSASVGRAERVQALNVANAIQQFQINLGAPPRVKSVKEAMQLPVGTEFIDPGGTVRTVTEEAVNAVKGKADKAKSAE